MRHIWILSLLLIACSEPNSGAEESKERVEQDTKAKIDTCICDGQDFKLCIEKKDSKIKFRDYLKHCDYPAIYDNYVDSLCSCTNNLQQVGLDCDFLIERMEQRFSKAELNFVSYLYEKKACFKN